MKYTPENLVEMSSLRDRLIDRIEVLSKVKQLFLIPGVEMMTGKMVADFYEVSSDTIKHVYLRNKAEIDREGTASISAKDFKQRHLVLSKVDFKTIAGRAGQATYCIEGRIVEVNNSGSHFFSPHAVLRIGMLLRDSEVAKEVRTQLLNIFEAASPVQRMQVIDEEGVMLLNIIRAPDEETRDRSLAKYHDYMNRRVSMPEAPKAET